MSALWSTDPRDALRVTDSFDLTGFDRASTPGFAGDKAASPFSPSSCDRVATVGRGTAGAGWTHV